MGQVMWSAFRGSGDDEYETPADAEAEVLGTLDGKWGPLVGQASLVAAAGSDLISAVLVVLDSGHDRTPLLAFAVTSPEWQGHGVGGWLIEKGAAPVEVRQAAVGSTWPA